MIGFVLYLSVSFQVYSVIILFENFGFCVCECAIGKLIEIVSMAMNGVVDDQYKVPLIAKLLHSLPHYNITFHRTNNTFRPTDEVYLEVCSHFS